MLAPATHAQPSRKGKKAWRKNVDVSEVQRGLDDVREEVIKGGVITEKESDALFATDLAGDEAAAKKAQGGKKLLKADEILALRSAVPGLAGRKRKAEDDKTTAAGRKKTKNGTFVPHKELQRLRDVADNVNGGAAVSQEAATHDPWSVTTPTQDKQFDFLEAQQQKREPSTLKEAPKPLTVSGKRTSNVRKPDAGKSYNPLVGDWSALLEREGAAAITKEQQRLVTEAEDNARQARLAAEAAKVEAAEKDQYATDYDSAWESEWDGFKSDGGEKDTVWTAKQKSRKTAVERNKIKARKDREAKEKHEVTVKARREQEKRIKQIAKEMSARDKARMAQARSLQVVGDDSSASEDEEQQLHRQAKRRFAKHPVPESALEVVLPEELEDSLRRLKPEGDLLTERYRNLLVNGKVDGRKRRDRAQWKQPRTERMEKWSYKDWKLK